MRRPPTSWLMLLVVAASIAFGWARLLNVQACSGVPEGWSGGFPPVPVATTRAGYDLPEGGAWPLWRHLVLESEEPGPIEVLVEVAEDDHIELIQVGQPASVSLVLSTHDQGLSGVSIGDGNPRWLACDGALPAPSGAIRARLEVHPEVVATVGDLTVRCGTVDLVPELRRVRSGVQRSRLLSIDGVGAPGLRWGVVLGLFGGLAAGFCVLGSLLQRRLRWVPLALAPAALTGPLSLVDAQWARIALRLPVEEPGLVLVLAPIGAAAACVLLGAVVEAARWKVLVALGVAVAAGGLVGGLAGAPVPGAVLGLAVAGVVVLNVRRPRGFNVGSLALMAVAAGSLEALVRGSALGEAWTGLSNKERARLTDELRKVEGEPAYSTYPISGWPIEPPERTQPIRIAVFGGSSTGGAFQNDDLDEFYPAMLERRLSGVQVVNQGVGAWTTYHIARYASLGLEKVDPDIAIAYVGHNDALTTSPVPYRDLHAQAQAGAGLSVALADLRLYQGLRFLVGAFRTHQGAAVPAEHARENLEVLIQAVRAEGGRVLLAREAVATVRSGLYAHEAMMRELVADDVAYADVARDLESVLSSGYFLDNVHLSREGHARAAESFHARLDELGWLEPGP